MLFSKISFSDYKKQESMTFGAQKLSAQFMEVLMRNDVNNPASAPEQFDEERTQVPPALQRRVVKQYGGAALIACVTILCMVVLDSWGYAIGFLFAAYIGWMGRDIISKWYSGKIVAKRVMCLKVQKIPLMKNKLIVMLKDLRTEAGEEASVKSYYIPTSSKDAAQFAERVIMNIYLENENSTELLAWQAIDVSP